MVSRVVGSCPRPRVGACVVVCVTVRGGVEWDGCGSLTGVCGTVVPNAEIVAWDHR